MDRRRYLASATALLTGLAGCTGSPGTSPTATSSPLPTTAGSSATPGDSPTDTEVGTASATQTPVVPPQDVVLPVSEDDLVRGAVKDGIPAIVEPEFAPDWSGVEDYGLADRDRVIGVVRNGEARAYPLRILDWHEVVNDTFDGPLLVTFCPLCGSGVTATRTVKGQETTFGVSGYLWHSDLVLYDELTESLWSQLLAKAINGEMTGTEFELVPSQKTSWGAFREAHPDARVLLPPPHSGTIRETSPRPYGIEPYSGYDESTRIGIGYNDFDDDRLHPKAQVLGIAHGGEAKAYPLDVVRTVGLINDTVGGRPVVVALAPGGTLVSYVRRVDGEVVEFSEADRSHMHAAGSRWQRATGVAIDGPHDGSVLRSANDRSAMFWFAWLDFFPETTVYGVDG